MFCVISVSDFSFLPPIVSPEGSVSVDIEPTQSVYTEGDDLLLTCSALGGPANTFQWQLNDANLTIETGAVLNRTDIRAGSDGGVYTCVVSNDAGNDSDNATVNILPVITQQPISVGVEISQIRSLECNATGFPPPTFQWFKLGGNLSGTVSGENTSVLSFNPVQYGDEGDYLCQVTSGNYTINSTSATLAGKPG